MIRICALIPSYNEARTIGKIVGEIRAMDIPVYVVDDGSSDETGQIAEQEGAIVIRNAKNMGKGASLRAGFERVLRGDCDAVVTLDGDDQHEAKSIPVFAKAMEELSADIVVGNRMLDTAPMPFVRQQTNRFMSYLISKICGQEVPDTQCGYRLIKRKVLKDIRLDSSNYEIESEMIIKSGRKGFRIVSVPIRTVYEDQKSRINPIIDTLRFFALIIRTALKR